MGNFIDSLSGSDAADASTKAAEMQLQGTREGIDAQRDFLKKIRGDLAPYRNAGRRQLSGLNALISDPNAQLSFIQNNPFFSALADDAQNRLMNVQAASGRLGTGDTPAALQNQLLMLGNGLLQESIGNRFNMATMGQNAAAQTGTMTQGVGNSITDLITGGANARASGVMGAANARAAGANNLLNAGMNGIGMIALSDRRFKCDVEQIGELIKGLPVYVAKYVGSMIDMICLMSQDVEKVIPGAVLDVFGVKYVDYSEVGRHLNGN